MRSCIRPCALTISPLPPTEKSGWRRALRAQHSGPAGIAELNGGELSPGPQVQTDAQVLEWVARDAETALHPACTCRLGVDALAVVAPDSLRVHGVDGLRVWGCLCDAQHHHANIYAPVMMIAEK
ncbi:oxygen-dependent choline dehydrogenase, partial [Anaerolineaceae bacterium]